MFFDKSFHALIAAEMECAMGALNLRRASGVFVYLSDYLEQYAVEGTKLAFKVDDLNELARDGSINPEFFATVYDGSYRLKKGLSASETLKTLLFGDYGYLSILDCASALVICLYYAFMRFLQVRLGDEQGKEAFDLLFGHKERELPFYQRMLITIFGPYSGSVTENFDQLLRAPFNPMSCFIHVVPAVASVGSSAYFKGHPDYLRKHGRTPGAHAQGWHLVQVASGREEYYVGFGLEGRVSLDVIKRKMVDAHNRPPFEESGLNLKQTIQAENLQGFSEKGFQVSQERCCQFLARYNKDPEGEVCHFHREVTRLVTEQMDALRTKYGKRPELAFRPDLD